MCKSRVIDKKSPLSFWLRNTSLHYFTNASPVYVGRMKVFIWHFFFELMGIALIRYWCNLNKFWCDIFNQNYCLDLQRLKEIFMKNKHRWQFCIRCSISIISFVCYILMITVAIKIVALLEIGIKFKRNCHM